MVDLGGHARAWPGLVAAAGAVLRVRKSATPRTRSTWRSKGRMARRLSSWSTRGETSWTVRPRVRSSQLAAACGQNVLNPVRAGAVGQGKGIARALAVTGRCRFGESPIGDPGYEARVRQHARAWRSGETAAGCPFWDITAHLPVPCRRPFLAQPRLSPQCGTDSPLVRVEGPDLVHVRDDVTGGAQRRTEPRSPRRAVDEGEHHGQASATVYPVEAGLPAVRLLASPLRRDDEQERRATASLPDQVPDHPGRIAPTVGDSFTCTQQPDQRPDEQFLLHQHPRRHATAPHHQQHEHEVPVGRVRCADQHALSGHIADNAPAGHLDDHLRQALPHDPSPLVILSGPNWSGAARPTRRRARRSGSCHWQPLPGRNRRTETTARTPRERWAAGYPVRAVSRLGAVPRTGPADRQDLPSEDDIPAR